MTRFTGLGAIAVLWTSLAVASQRAGFDLLGERTLSYLGTERPSALLFSGGLIVGAVLLARFHGYVRASFPVPLGFSVAMLGGLAGQLVAAVVPVGGADLAHRVHTVSALGLGASLPLLMWRFASGQPDGRSRRLAYGFFWAEVAACVAGLLLSRWHVAPLAEVLPAAVFHAWIVAVTVGAPNWDEQMAY